MSSKLYYGSIKTLTLLNNNYINVKTKSVAMIKHFILKSHIELEDHNILIKILRTVSVPLLNNLPQTFIKLFMKKSSHDASTVVNKGGTTHALEAMYTRYERGIFSRGYIRGVADLFLH